MFDQIRETQRRLEMRIAELELTLRSLVADIEEYERINHLSPSPGKRDCWQSVTHAKAILGKP